MEKKPPIPEDMISCLEGYFGSKEFDDDLNALFEEVQQAEYSANPEKAKSHGEVSQPQYDLASVVQFFANAIEDTDECKDIISKITREQIEASVKKELEDIRKNAEVSKSENEMNKKEIVEIFRRMIRKEFEHINKEYFPNYIQEESEDVAAKIDNVVKEEKKLEKNVHIEDSTIPQVNEEEKNAKVLDPPIKLSLRSEEVELPEQSKEQVPPPEEVKDNIEGNASLDEQSRQNVNEKSNYELNPMEEIKEDKNEAKDSIQLKVQPEEKLEAKVEDNNNEKQVKEEEDYKQVEKEEDDKKAIEESEKVKEEAKTNSEEPIASQ